MKLIFRLAKDNITHDRRLYLPFILSTMGIIALSYIIYSLSQNEAITMTYAGAYVQTFLSMGFSIILVFSTIFLFYTNGFIIKKRKSQLGLYNVLGLSKRDIAKVLFAETIMVYAISMVLGIIIGIILEKLAFLIILKLLGLAVIFGFTIELSAILVIFICYSILFIALYIYSAVSVYKTDPIKLLREKDKGEKEPKAKWLIAILGLVCMVAGYYLANMEQTAMTSIAIFFPAVILVILGTYLLFTAGSIALLKVLKKNKRYYYKTSHFISVSNLMFRMKKNAVGLASITIMATMILVMTASTTSMWFSLERTSDLMYPKDMIIEIDDPNVDDGKMVEAINSSLASIDNEALDLTYYNYGSLYGRFEDHELILNDSYTNNDRGFTALDNSTYNELTDSDIKLGPKEILVVYDGDKYPYTYMTINNEDYKIIEQFDDNIDILPDSDIINNSSECTLVFNDADISDITSLWRIYLFDLKKPLENDDGYYDFDFLSDVYDTYPEKALTTLYKADFETALRGIYAAFLFLGIFLGVAFMLSIILIMYYKQISEGDEDKERYKIMTKVGLSDKEIKKTINSQVIFVFFMPLIIAIIHLFGSFKMVGGIVSTLAQSPSSMYLYTSIIVTIAFVVFYIIVYLLTQKTYYHIVTRH